VRDPLLTQWYVGFKDRHVVDVNPLLVEPQRVPARSFVAKPYFLIDMPGARVEGVNLKSYPMKTKLVEAVPDNQLSRLTAKPPARPSAPRKARKPQERFNSFKSLSTTSPTIAFVA
jgi:hypothetical protein